MKKHALFFMRIFSFSVFVVNNEMARDKSLATRLFNI